MGAWPDLRKAHASYFQPGNVAVNKDIFARFIDANA